MPNSILKMVDSPDPMTRDGVLQALSEVPFVQHQYKWLVGEIARLPSQNAAVLLSGYCGARRLPPHRESRLREACILLSTLSEPEINALPDQISPVTQRHPTPTPPTTPTSRPGINHGTEGRPPKKPSNPLRTL